MPSAWGKIVNEADAKKKRRQKAQRQAAEIRRKKAEAKLYYLSEE